MLAYGYSVLLVLLVRPLAQCGDSCKDKLAPYLGDDDEDGWEFTDVPDDFHMDIRASIL